MQPANADEALRQNMICRPNISGAGRKRRLRAGLAQVVISLVTAALLVVFHASWQLRLLLGVPVMTATATLLQVTRNTCIAHAIQGTFEHDDLSKTKVSEADAAASRRVAFTIYRDAILVGIVSAGVMAATAFIG